MIRSYRRTVRLVNWASAGMLFAGVLCAVLIIGTRVATTSAAADVPDASPELAGGLHIVHLGHSQAAQARTATLAGTGALSAPNEDIDGVDLWSGDSVGLLIDMTASPHASHGAGSQATALPALQVTATASSGETVTLPYKISNPEQGAGSTLCCRLRSSYPASVTYVDVTVQDQLGRHRTWRIQRLNRPQPALSSPRMAAPQSPSKSVTPERPNQCTPQRLVPEAVIA